MEIDELFRTIFKNKFLRRTIFKHVSNYNKLIYGGKVKNGFIRKYNSCSITWCAKSSNFQLLIYKLQKEPRLKIEKEFIDDLFYNHFLENNTDLILLKKLFKIFPKFLPNQSSYSSSKLIEHLFNFKINQNPKDNFEIIKFVIEKLKVIPTSKSINHCCFSLNTKLLKYCFDNGFLSIKKGDPDIGLLICVLKSNDFNFYKIIYDLIGKESLTIISTKNLTFMQHIVQTNLSILKYTYKFEKYDHLLHHFSNQHGTPEIKSFINSLKF